MMQTWKIAGIVVAIVAFSVTLFGQAAAEGALTHALSSAAGSTVGPTLGAAQNRLAGRLGQRVSNATPNHQFSTIKNVGRTATPAQAGPAAAPFSGSLIASIQGGEPTETSCASSGNTTQATPGEKPENPDVKVRKGCSVPTGKNKDDHPSVINLPAAK